MEQSLHNDSSAVCECCSPLRRIALIGVMQFLARDSIVQYLAMCYRPSVRHMGGSVKKRLKLQ